MVKGSKSPRFRFAFSCTTSPKVEGPLGQKYEMLSIVMSI